MKRMFLLLLSLTVSALVFSCAAPDAPGGDSYIGILEDNATAVDDDGGEAPPLFTPLDADFGGYNFRMAGFYSYQHMWVAAGYSEIYAEELNGDPINDAVFNRNRIVEELYNIEISLFPLSYGDRGGHADILLRSIMAGDNAFDAGLVLGIQMPRLLTTPNALVELRSINSMNLENPWWDQTANRDLSIANQLHTTTGDMSLYSAFGTVVMFFNKQMVEDYALDNPYQLVRDGAWTWDKLHEMTRTVARDLDGDGIFGQNDQIGIMAQPVSLVYSIIAGGMRMIEKDESDLPFLLGNSMRLSSAVDTILAALTDQMSAINIGAVTGFSAPFFEWALPKFRDNEAFIFYNQLLVALNLREMEVDFGILPAPKVDAAQQNYYSVATQWWITYLIVPQTNMELERTGAILEAMGYHSRRLVMPAFYDVTVTHKLARDDDSVDMLNIILSNRIYDLATIYNWGNILAIFEQIYNSRNNNIASAFEARSATINAAIERTLSELLG